MLEENFKSTMTRIRVIGRLAESWFMTRIRVFGR